MAGNDRFITTMGSLFRHYVDELWGPYRGPGGPHMGGIARLEPDPHPWRELAIAYQLVSLADALELTGKGAGVSLLQAFAEDPDFTCGTRPPGWPRPKKGDGRRLDPAVLGAALVFVAEGAGHGDVAGAAREAGQSLVS